MSDVTARMCRAKECVDQATKFCDEVFKRNIDEQIMPALQVVDDTAHDLSHEARTMRWQIQIALKEFDASRYGEGCFDSPVLGRRVIPKIEYTQGEEDDSVLVKVHRAKTYVDQAVEAYVWVFKEDKIELIMEALEAVEGTACDLHFEAWIIAQGIRDLLHVARCTDHICVEKNYHAHLIAEKTPEQIAEDEERSTLGKRKIPEIVSEESE